MKGDLNQLAEQLGVAVKYLVGVYSKLAPVTWYIFGITLVIWLVISVVVFYTYRAFRRAAYKEQQENGMEGDTLYFGLIDMGYIMAFVFAFLFVVAVGNSLSHAIKANASPKAYALDQILQKLK